MSALPVTEPTPDQLRAEAQHWHEESARLRRLAISEAERLRGEAVKAGAMAVRLENRADELESRSEAPSDDWEASPRAELAGRILKHLERAHRPKAASAIAAYLDVSPEELRPALVLAMNTGMVKRIGLNRGTKYAAAHRVEEQTPDPFGKTWLERVRDVAVRLQTFTVKEAHAELPALSEQTVRRWLNQLVDDGVLETARDGRTLIYAYVPPPESGRVLATPRPLESPRPGTAHGGRSAVPGTGNGRGAGRADVRDYLIRAKKLGLTVSERKHSYLILRDGQVVGNFAKTTSDKRAITNALSNLARNGVYL
jgi:hypothetical protein